MSQVTTKVCAYNCQTSKAYGFRHIVGTNHVAVVEWERELQPGQQMQVIKQEGDAWIYADALVIKLDMNCTVIARNLK